MGQQLNKIIKRRRRKAYLVRKKALAKQGIVRKASRSKTVEAGADKAVKKTAVKKSTKTPSAKKPAAKVEETTAAE